MNTFVLLSRVPEPPDRTETLRFLPILDEEEKRRYAAFRRDMDRDLYLVSHLLRRMHLSRVAARSPSAWQFGRALHGRLVLLDPPDPVPYFSLSHAAGIAASAVSLAAPVGIDIEAFDAAESRDPLIETVCAKSEIAALNAEPLENRPRRLVEIWTLKEAALKVWGIGFAVAPVAAVTTHQRADHWLVTFAGAADRFPPCHCWLLRVLPEHALAIATTAANAPAPTIEIVDITCPSNVAVPNIFGTA